jgi:hypothetical protein
MTEPMSLRAADHIRGKSYFLRYRAGLLWYRTDDTGLEFPVPTVDLEGAELAHLERSSACLKWIRRHLETLTAAVLARQAASMTIEERFPREIIEEAMPVVYEGPPDAYDTHIRAFAQKHGADYDELHPWAMRVVRDRSMKMFSEDDF